jgi:hypothetical protein
MKTAKTCGKGGKSRAMKHSTGLKKANAANARSKMNTKMHQMLNAKYRK